MPTIGVGDLPVNSAQVQVGARLGGTGSTATPLNVPDGAIDNAALDDMAAATIKGRLTGTGAPQDLTKSQAQGILSVDDLITLTGVADGAVNFGTFTGTTIADNQTLKAILQALETAVEAASGGGGGGSSWYDAGNGAYVRASAAGVTFARTSSSVWTFTIPDGVHLESATINSSAGQSATAALDLDFVFAGSRPYNQETDLDDAFIPLITTLKKTSPAQYPTTTAGNNPNWTAAVATPGTLRLSTSEFTEVGGGGSQGSTIKILF